MEMGPRRWYEAWYESVDKIKLPTKMFLNDYVEELEALEVSDDGAYEGKKTFGNMFKQRK